MKGKCDDLRYTNIRKCSLSPFPHADNHQVSHVVTKVRIMPQLVLKYIRKPSFLCVYPHARVSLPFVCFVYVPAHSIQYYSCHPSSFLSLPFSCLSSPGILNPLSHHIFSLFLMIFSFPPSSKLSLLGPFSTFFPSFSFSP